MFSKYFSNVIILEKSEILLYEIFIEDILYLISLLFKYIILEMLLWDKSKVNKFGKISNNLFKSILFSLFLDNINSSQFLVIFKISEFDKDAVFILFNNSSKESFVKSKLNKLIVFNLSQCMSILIFISSLFLFFSSSIFFGSFL